LSLVAGSGGLAARFSRFFFAAGPPAVAVAVWGQSIAAHPVLAIVTFLAYEALVAGARFFGQIAGDLRDRWRNPITDHLDNYIRRRISRFGKRYREWLLTTIDKIDQKGLETVGWYTPKLDQVYIELSVAFRAPHQIPTSLLAAGLMGTAERHNLKEYLDSPTSTVHAIIGGPGSGKTTLLRHTAQDIYRTDGRRRRPVPILIYLRDHAGAIASNLNMRLSELIARGLISAGGPVEPKGWFEQQLRKGRCVVLFDGLDEVASHTHRMLISDWVERQVQYYGKNDFVITSRPQGYVSAPVSGAHVVSVLAFTEAQTTMFVQKWYSAVEGHAQSGDDKDHRARAESAANDLLERLAGAPDLYELTTNPLLLTMIVNVHRHRGVLPGSRAKLYREICHVMLGLRQEVKKLPVNLDRDRKETLLRELAYTMMRRRVATLPRHEVIAELKPRLRRLSQELAVEDFLADVASNGLMVEREHDQFSFAHLTFQEYLAAMHIAGRESEREVLINVVGDSWWRETTLLYTAQSNADPIVRACVASATVSALALAFDCTEQQDRELDPELSKYLNQLLASAFDPTTPAELRRLMAGVLATRHLRPVVRTETSSRISISPITSGIYWLFQQDKYDRQFGTSSPTLSARGLTVTGVRGAEALDFVRWINEITGGPVPYRLPTTDEMHHPAVRRALAKAAPDGVSLSVWTAPNTDPQRLTLWTTPGSRHPHEMNWTTVVRHVEQDLQRATSTLARLLLVHSIVANRLRYTLFERTVDLASSKSRMLIPVITGAVTLARTQPSLFEAALKNSAELDRRLTAAVDLQRPVGLESAFQMTRTARTELTENISLENSRELVQLDLDVAIRAAATLDRRGLSASAVDQILALDAIVSIDQEQLVNASPGTATSYNQGLALNGFAALDRSVGFGFAYALASSVYARSDAQGCSQAFTSAFIEAIDMANPDNEKSCVVSPESLTAIVDNAYQVGMHQPGIGDSSWARQVLINLRQEVAEAIRMRHVFTNQAASAVRLAAMCLAIAASVHKATDLVAMFRQIAAGITLLECWTTKSSAPTETVMLASS
jgi:hypothetical protein